MSLRSADTTLDTANERGRAVRALMNTEPGPSSPPPYSRKISNCLGRDMSAHDASSANNCGYQQQDRQEPCRKGYVEQHDHCW